MSNLLQQYFPMIRSEKEVLNIIQQDPNLMAVFNQWLAEQQKQFLNFCTGARGVKMLYDAFAKSILDPDATPERLNELLSLLLKKEVTILQTIPADNSRIADESSLVVMDILVKLDDGSLANVEIQKIGYRFPGQRSACYSADLLLRQYVKARGQKTKDTFSYRDIKTVYTIVLFEHSTKEFHSFPKNYVHTFEQKSDTGLKIDLLQKYVFIPLDIFLKIYQNTGKKINNRLEAWLLFLVSDDPEDIINLIETYPDFRDLYEQVYTICRNIEEVMGMFSKELQILDRNTVRYMIDEMQEELEAQKAAIGQQNATIDQQNATIDQQNTTIDQQNTTIDQQNTIIEQQKKNFEAEKSILVKDTTETTNLIWQTLLKNPSASTEEIAQIAHAPKEDVLKIQEILKSVTSFAK